ncbi:hypothetical protein AB0F30_31915 [Streptomyces sp. NPDC029006]|uniref:hypothetical protein n=1 Tax=Streptomyces sp. NPDC029006 TaxID=3155467 RepID=UPI0033F0449D
MSSKHQHYEVDRAPRVTWEQRATAGDHCDKPEKVGKAAVHDPERVGIAAKGVRQKLTEIAEQLPGRRS